MEYLVWTGSIACRESLEFARPNRYRIGWVQTYLKAALSSYPAATAVKPSLGSGTESVLKLVET